MLLKEISWNHGNEIDELVAWGIWPINELVKILDEYNDDEDERIMFLCHAIREKTKEMELALYRIKQEFSLKAPGREV